MRHLKASDVKLPAAVNAIKRDACPKCKGVPAVRYSTEGITDEPGGTEGVAVCLDCGGSGKRSDLLRERKAGGPDRP